MTYEHLTRLTLVRELLCLSRPIASLVPQLATLNWDFDGDAEVLCRFHIVSILERFLGHDLSAADVELWANQVEGRDDICFESGHEVAILDAINELANPTLTRELNDLSAATMIKTLRKTPTQISD